MTDIVGTAGPDSLNGTAGDDTITGLGGNDIIDGGDGNDVINGGAGNDQLSGGNGNDIFIEDELTQSTETFNGGAGTDTIEFRTIPAPITTASGTFAPHSVNGANSLTSIERFVFASTVGGPVVGANMLLSAVSTSGLTELVGGAGREFLAFNTSTGGTFTMPVLTMTNWAAPATNGWDSPTDYLVLTSSATAGTAVTLNAASGLNTNQVLSGGLGNDTLNGSANTDYLNGGGGTNNLFGNDGNDSLAITNSAPPNGQPTTFNGAGGTLDGGNGTDVLTIGGYVDLQATLVSIEGVNLLPAFFPPVQNTNTQFAAYLNLDSAHLAMLPGSAFFRGTGTVGIRLNAGQSFNGSQYVIDPNADVTFEIFGGSGAATFTGSSTDDIFNFGAGSGIQTAVGGGGDDVFVLAGQFATATSGVQFSGGAGDDALVLNSYAGAPSNGGVPTSTYAVGALSSVENVAFQSQLNTTVQLVISRADYLTSGITLFAGGSGRDVIVFTISAAGDYAMPTANLVNWNQSQGDFLVLAAASGMNDNVTLRALEGIASGQALIGANGSDTIFGSAGGDFLDGGAGADSLGGGAGNDLYVVNTQADLIFEAVGGGLDQVQSSSDYYLYANVENLLLTTTANLFGVGNDLANSIIGNPGENLLLGGAGDDTISGGAARDALFGESGNDTLNGDAGIDYIVAGIGNDIVNGGDDADEVYGQEGDDRLTGGASFSTDILVGGDGNDTIFGNSGQGDYDLMYGNLGNDIFYVDTPADLVFEQAGEGTDTVYANINGAGYYLYDNIENLILEGQTPFGVGNASNNSITGNAIGNYLLGGAGDDRLNGGAGNDVLFGEAGADTFIFTRGTGGDVIGDFQRGTDKIDLSTLGFTFAQLQAAFSQVGNDGAINLGNGDFIVLQGVTMSTLTASDFVLGGP